jgi:hypothetical protein
MRLLTSEESYTRRLRVKQTKFYETRNALNNFDYFYIPIQGRIVLILSLKNIQLFSILIFICVFLFEEKAQAQIYSYTTFDNPNASTGSTYALGLNDNNQIVGYYADGKTHGFIYNGNSYKTLDVPNSNATYAWNINNNGVVVGTYSSSIGTHGFLFDGSAYKTVDVPNSIPGSTNAIGISNNGVVSGWYYDNTGHHGFTFDGNSYKTLEAPDATNGTYAQGINDNGQITGSYYDTNGHHNYVYDNIIYSTVAAPGGVNICDIQLNCGIKVNNQTGGSFVWDINNAGTTAGSYTDNLGFHGFVFDGIEHVTLDSPTALGLSLAWGINNLGQVVGYYNDFSGVHGFLATPTSVPIPTSFWLLGTTLVGFFNYKSARKADSPTGNPL